MEDRKPFGGNQSLTLRIVIEDAGHFHVCLTGDSIYNSFADQIVANDRNAYTHPSVFSALGSCLMNR